MPTIAGTSGDDQNPAIEDLVGNDLIKALDGDDYIRMRVGGTDRVEGGQGSDVVFTRITKLD